MTLSPSLSERRLSGRRPAGAGLMRLGQTQYWFILGATVIAAAILVLLASANS